MLPDSWKAECIVPITKSGHPNVTSNNRPISLFGLLPKVWKVFCTQLSAYFYEHHLLPPAQCAYRPRHSSENAALDAVERLVVNTDDGWRHLAGNEGYYQYYCSMFAIDT